MMYQILNAAGMMMAQMLLYRPSLVIRMKVGIRPPPKYIGISRKMLQILRPTSLGEVSGYAHRQQVTSIRKVGMIV